MRLLRTKFFSFFFGSSSTKVALFLSFSYSLSALLSTYRSIKPTLVMGKKVLATNKAIFTSINNSKNEHQPIEDDYFYRFKNIPKLYPHVDEKILFHRLRYSHVCVIGLGGVGSWATEALARSGIQYFTLIDLDDICVSNINRQSHALSSTIGKFKVDVLRDRILDINPYANISTNLTFITKDNINAIFDDIDTKYSYVVEAIDDVSDKVSIVHACVERNIPIVMSGGGAGLIDPSMLAISDLSKAEGDNLIMRVRKCLRQQYGFPTGETTIHRKSNARRERKDWNVTVVHTQPIGMSRSPEDILRIKNSTSYSNNDNGDSGHDNQPQACELKNQESSSWRKCDGVLGNACFVTGTMGFMMASVVVNNVALSKSIRPNLEVIQSIRNSMTKKTSPGINNQTVEGNHKSLLSQEASNSYSNNNASNSINLSSLGIGSQPIHTANDLNLETNENDDNVNDISSNSNLLRLSELHVNDHDRSSESRMELIDSHSHLQLDPLYSFVNDAIIRANHCAIKHISICGVCPGEDWDRIHQLSERYPTILLPQYGLHPWWISRYRQDRSMSDLLDSIRVNLEQKLISNSKAGVGECGLDKNIKRQTNIEDQEIILREHMSVASKYHRPITFHCVHAWGRLLDCLQTSQTLQFSIPSVILHSCNSMPIELLSAFINLGNVFFSFNGRQLGTKEQQLLTQIPLERLLLESDSPDQLPSSLSTYGLRCNEPTVVRYTCYEVARVLNRDPMDIALSTTRNAQQVYMLSSSSLS